MLTAACGPDALVVVGTFDAGTRDGGEDERLDAGPPAADGAAFSPACPAQFAARTLRNALCVCDGVRLATGGLLTDAFDSRAGPYTSSTAQAAAGDVGIVGALSATTNVFSDAITIGGTLTVDGALGPDALPALSIGRDLRVGGPFAYANSV